MSAADTLDRAAGAIRDADALVITAGAGMGVGSGLPDFRGDEGFWRAYPPLRDRGIRFVEMADPAWFTDEPRLAWGFYGHRLQLYRNTTPHAGFGLLAAMAAGRPTFVFTSNVDGQFQRAGVADDAVYEVHGSIHHLQVHQSADPRDGGVWPANDVSVSVDPTRFLAQGPLPTAPSGALARPNVLMFGDWGWVPDRAARQEGRFGAFVQRAARGNLVVVEVGAGTAVPTVRHMGERLMQAAGATLIRINPREAHGPAGTCSVEAGGLAGIRALADRV